MSECPHKQLKKQLVGEQVWYVCECGQKFKAEPWDGRVVALAELQAQFNEHAQNCPKCWATLRHGSRDIVCDKGAAILAKEICEAEALCPECSGTGVIETGNNDLPCSCPKGDTAIFNTVDGQRTGAELKRERTAEVKK